MVQAKRDSKGRFVKGNKPWNKGVKGIHLHKDTEFKVNQNVGESHPSWNGGITNPSKDCAEIWVDNKKYIRRPKYIYEKHHGKIPDGYVIYHIDGNNKNDHISNLEAISRAELVKRNKLKSKKK